MEDCKVKNRCGGCCYQGVPYEKQLEEKQKKIDKLLGGFVKAEPIAGMKDPFHYRNKVHHVFAYDRKKGILSGCYEEKTHRVVDIPHCLIEDEKSQEIIATVKELCRSFKIRTYDEDTGFGSLRHVLVRRGFKSGEIMVVLVLGDPILPGKNNFVRALLKKHPEITTVVLNINDKKTSMVLGDREKILYGPGFIRDELCGRKYRISAKSFYQINPVQTEVLYRTAIEFAGLTGTENVIDAYCGVGTIGLTASGKAARVTGVELNSDAVKDAVLNAKENGVANAEFLCGDAGKFMTRLAEAGKSCDVVFMDPPRSGSTEEFMASCIRLGPSRIVYVSCGPDTLARDLKYFSAHGYQVKRIRPVDMFPFTEHVEVVSLLSRTEGRGEQDETTHAEQETVCLLSKLSDTKHHVEVELNLDEMDLTTAESKATYDEIRDYVMAQTGLQVSNLYIAQVKRECGIIERENYNKAKSEESKQPRCPEDKRKAIVKALKHFGMI